MIPLPSLLLVLLFSSSPVGASHPQAEIDLCEVYKDRLPPGLTLALLPDATAQGALLLSQYCTQCHNLPGPDRHTAAEWSEVSSKMFLLMEVSNRFGGWMGHVEVLSSQQQETLLGYLQRYAGDAEVVQSPLEKGFTLPLWFSRILALLPVLLLLGVGLRVAVRAFTGGHKR
jgi:hypothetical protein